MKILSSIYYINVVKIYTPTVKVFACMPVILYRGQCNITEIDVLHNRVGDWNQLRLSSVI